MRRRNLRTSRLRIAVVGLSVVLSLAAAGCKHDNNAGQSPAPKPTSPSASQTSAAPTPKPTSRPASRPASKVAAIRYDPLSGGKKVDGPVVGVKIDNVAQARPQAGVYLADVVVAERVEGNLTRLLAIYHTHWPKRIGPVRSARNTDVQFLPMFSKAPGLVFSGANHKVLHQLRLSPIRRIQRDNRDNSRIAPHNVFVNMSYVKKLAGLGKEQPIGFAFGSSPQWGSAAKAASFTIPIGVDRYGFRYAGDHYRGTWNGRNQTDENGTPVEIDNIVDLKVRYHHDTDTTADNSDVAETVGKGRVVVYSRGKRISGTWERKSLSGPMTLTTSGGNKIVLARGHTWIMLDG